MRAALSAINDPAAALHAAQRIADAQTQMGDLEPLQ
jgi:hypothetical protein